MTDLRERSAVADAGTEAAVFLLEPAARAEVAGFLEPRAGAVDAVESAPAGEARIREGLTFLNAQALASAGDEDRPNADLGRVGRTIATAAFSDLSTAFTLWCHRMVLEYLSCAPRGSFLRTDVLPRVWRTEWLGSTALAAAMAHCVAGTPLPVAWRREGDAIVIDGRVSWASNLYPPRFVMVTAAAHVDDGREVIVALRGDTPGLRIDPYPRLLALQATGSSSVALCGVRVTDEWLITGRFAPFVARVRPVFLILQSSFCWGLGYRSLVEARAGLRGVAEVFGDDLAQLEGRAAQLATQLAAAAGTGGAGVPIRSLVQLRLDCALLATAAVALEAKVAGGRGYAMASATARRLREAAFIPIQAPTEGQLRWELSRSA
jgi:alkylation response protein AidB-like acyl-CoA dehydrogenase